MLHFLMVKAQSRRRFLQSAPLAAVSLTLADTTLLAQPPAPAPEPFKLITAAQLADAMKSLQTKPGNEDLFNTPALPFTVVLTTEEKKAAKEFEYHEGRDHIVQILDGATLYEVGGTPQSPRSTKPSEWLAPTSAGASTFTLHKGDTLVIPRNTPHKRTTESSVTLILISTTGKP